MIYLDYAATTQVAPQVLATYLKITEDYYAHPSSVNRNGLAANALLDEVRQKILTNLNLPSHQVTFTSGGTEANNLAILGIAASISKPKHFITSQIEHPSVYETFKYLETIGHQVTYLAPDKQGIISPQSVASAITNQTVLISLMTVNNEIGTINPISEISQIAQSHNILMMSDFVQAIGKVDPKILQNVDLITLSSHKVYAPKGAGCLIYQKKLNLSPIMHGGTAEHKLRPGTQNLPAIVAFAHGINLVTTKLPENHQKILELSQYTRQKLADVPQVKILTDPTVTIPSIINFTISEIPSEVTINTFSQHDIIISAMSSCSIGTNKQSRVILSLTGDSKLATTSVRLSISHHTTISQIDQFLKILKTIK